MQIYQTKESILPGTSYKEVREQAILMIKQVKKGTKRKPYIRSVYFKRQKVFFDFFWAHLLEKNPKERFRRLKYLAAGIEVIKKTRHDSATQENPHKSGEILHRFAGLTREKELFYVQIKEDKRTHAKYFMSIFPE
ncbi:hypothetical protein KKC88_01375 [Patescibacteria group bacterium]|nr:hypothetical protein [Patescibacteria group bacterium]MBU1673478.1 hypothetical protein [Patescibacteria group bacterium]MBU1963991.1 hypothetical protein [Patescibacteria group bacterium]